MERGVGIGENLGAVPGNVGLQVIGNGGDDT